jgi:uncharacterized membrane protein YgaE (UPF0421/DUF939 family)
LTVTVAEPLAFKFKVNPGTTPVSVLVLLVIGMPFSEKLASVAACSSVIPDAPEP